MGLSTGIIGLPNVGKSTLFNAITNSSVEAANYPFATIEPNIGIVNVNDKRLVDLANLINPDKISFNFIKFVDIAGLVKGASKGEGLGNKFLQNIREVDSLCHVIRCFSNNDITHVNENIDPIFDLEIINWELIYSDIDVLNNRLNKINKLASSGNKIAIFEKKIYEKILEHIQKGFLANTLNLGKDEIKFVKSLNLLTIKPILYVANIDENSLSDLKNNNYYQSLIKKVGEENVIPISSKLEYEISLLKEEQKKDFMSVLNIEISGLDLLILKSYKLLNLSTFFTFGKTEVKAWSFLNGMTAPECAGIIHSDFQRGFIKAEIIKYEDMINFKNENAVKENGKSKLVGKDYLVSDGDICHFKFNVTKK